MRKIDEIIIHCSATAEGKDFRAKDIDRWHRQRGFSKIGYHYVIDLDGKIEAGRELDEVGAHCKGHNAHSIGICYIGGLTADGKTPKDTRTDAQCTAMQMLVGGLLTALPSIKRVVGHNKYAAKACPCFAAEQEFKLKS